MNNIKKNISYNMIYQLLNMLLPLITTPYIARVMGTNGVGIYSYTYAIIQYFMMFILLGLNNYGNRTIAKSKDNKNQLQQNFWNIYYEQIISFIIVSIIYFIYVSIFACKEYSTIFIIEYIFLLATALDINWLFHGLENFRITVIRNLASKIILTIMIFLFVKKENDLTVYILLMALSTFIGNISLWSWVIKNIKIINPNFKEIFKHFKKNIILFIPVIAISIYNIMDKIMIGNILSVDKVGLYDNAEKIINIPLNILAAIGTAMLPRISNLIANNKKEQIIKYIDSTMHLIFLLAFPIVTGLILVSDKIVIIYLGEKFNDSIILVKFLSIIIIFKLWANVIRTQYLIPNEKDKLYISSVLLGAIINLLLNILLIKKYGVIGAVYGTIGAEFAVCACQTISVINNLPIKKYINYILEYLIKSILMLLCLKIEIKIFNLNSLNDLIYLIIITISGLFIYVLLNIKYLKKIYLNIKKTNDKNFIRR